MATDNVVANILETLLNNVNASSTSLSDLTASINLLSVNVEKLTAVLSTLLSNNVALNLPSSSINTRKASYYDHLTQNNYVNKRNDNANCNETSTSLVNSKHQITFRDTNNETAVPAAFMEDLIQLKNLRLEAYYKMKRNILLSDMYTQNLKHENKRIPKRFEPSFSAKEPIDIKNHKIETAITLTKNQIKALAIHEQIQKNKYNMLDNKIRSHIQEHPDKKKQDKLTKNYEKIIKEGCERIDKKLLAKSGYFNSNMYMTTVSFFKSSTTENSKSQPKEIEVESEDTDIDDVSIVSLFQDTQQIAPPIAETDELSNKRRACNSLSSIASGEGSKTETKKLCPTSQPALNSRSQNTKIPIPKNSFTQSTKAKMK